MQQQTLQTRDVRFFANSFGHETYILEAAGEYPDVQFCHATGYQAARSGLDNMHNYFTAVYESRYVSGVVAGLKTESDDRGRNNQRRPDKDGLCWCIPVRRGYFRIYFFLPWSKECMPVRNHESYIYTNSWASFDLEKKQQSP